ncbi:MAG: VRR-NUC domain-containing protein [Telluria sp.]
MTEPITPPPLATGGMSPDGTTTVVKINKPKIDPLDKKILCAPMCKCDKSPKIAVDGKRLKQNCVAESIKALNGVLGNSNYKQEINYNMTKNPPEPIMDSTIRTLGHKYLSGHIKKHMGDYFVKGTGQIRRPDIVIVHDSTKPPTQDNIKQIVEMKFPPDSLSDPQRVAYQQIAGDKNKLATLKPDDCDCEKDKPGGTMIPVEKLESAGKASEVLMRAVTRGKSKGLPGSANPGLTPAPAF